MNTDIVTALRPHSPDLDPAWQVETLRTILDRQTMDVPLRTAPRRLERASLIVATAAAVVAGLFLARALVPADDVRPAPPARETVQRIDPSDGTKLKLGASLDVVADLPNTYDGRRVLFFAFTDDHTLVGDLDVIPNGGAPGLQQSHAVMYDLDEKAFTILDDRERPEPMQIVDISGNDDTVVWAELAGMHVDSSDFLLYAYDRRTKEVATLGEFHDPDGQIVYGNDLAISGGRAYFSTNAYPKKRGQEAVYTVPVDGSEPPSVLAPGGVRVRIAGDTLTYSVPNPKDREAYPTYVKRDLSTGQTSPVPVSAHVNDPGFCGAEVTDAWETWCVGRVARDETLEPALLTIKEASGRITEFAPFLPKALNAPIPHDVKMLGEWTAITMTLSGGQDREFLVDLDTKEVKIFPDNTSFTSVSPDRSMALISSFAGKGPGPQRIVRIPAAD